MSLTISTKCFLVVLGLWLCAATVHEVEVKRPPALKWVSLAKKAPSGLDGEMLNRAYDVHSLEEYAKYVAESFGLSHELVFGVVAVESTWKHTALSKVGAKGLMQLMPDTAVLMGWDRKNSLYDPTINLYYGCKLLKTLLDKYKTVNIALIAYYAGDGRADQYLRKQILHGDFRTELITYAKKVQKNKSFWKPSNKVVGK